MLFIELRWLLFGFLLAVVVVALLAVWLDRRLCRRQEVRPLVPGEVAAVLERAPFGLLALEGNHACRYANPYARRLLELEASAGQLPVAEWTYRLAQDRRAARGELAATGRYRSVPIGSGQFVRWWVTAWGNLDLVFLWDATAHYQAEQAARALLDDFSHELRTPLAVLLAHLEVLRLPDISEEMRQQSIHLMLVEAQRLSRMANNLLELSRLEISEVTERRPVNLLALVEESIVQVAPRATERQVAVSLEVDTPLSPVLGDPDRIKQVFLNLLDNAVKYSRIGDRVVISLRGEEDGIVCAVDDSGPGIPAEHLPHVTRRFYRGVFEDSEAGSGLGLALVQEILRRHQSRLEIESQAEGNETGTCVRFVLPVLLEKNMEG